MGAYADLLPDSSDSANTSSSVARSSGNQRVDAFVEQYRPIAERVAEQTGNDPELYLAKWGLETGWGKSIIPGTNNLGNIKDFSGSGVSAKDNATGSVDRYRQYKDANQFADDYASLLNRRYKNALNVGSDMDTFATELKRAGYAEDPNYVSKLKSAYNMLGGSAAQSDASQPSPNARGEYEPRTDYSAALRQFDKVPNDTYEANRLASTPKGMSISKEISAAIDSYQANLWSIPAAMGSEYALNAMLENKSAAEQQWADSGAPQSFSEMEFGKNFGQYFAHMAIQSAPYMLEFIASGFGVGSLAKGALANTAKGVAEKAAIEAAKQGATKEAAKKAGEVAAKEFMGTVYTASGVAGSYPSAVGDVLSNQYEQSGKFNLPAAAALGVPYAALNAAGAEGMLTRGLARGLPKTSLTAKGAAGFAGRAALTGAEAGLMEGSTETGQEVMNQLGRMAVDPDAKIDDKRALEAYKESFIAGGLLGGVPGAVAGGFRKPEDAKLQPPAPVANSPLSNAAQAAQAADPITEALKPISERFADRALYEQIRNHPNLGPDAMTQILSAYRVATNSNMDPMARQAAVDRLGEFFRLFDNQPNFTAGKADAPGVPAVVGNPSGAVGPADPRVGAIDGEASRVAPNQQQGVVTQSAPALATDERARKAAAAEYEAAYQDLVKAEQLGVSDQELMQRQIAMRNAENRLQEINEAIEANRAKETAEKRGALLDRVLASNPGNPNRAFDRALRLEGFRDSTFTEEEKSKIARFNELRSIQEDGVFSAPNEAGAFGIREKRESAPAGRYQHLADMLSSGWQLANRHQLTGPNGEVYNLKGAGEAQFVRNKLNQKDGNGNQSPRGGAQGGTDQGDFGVGGAGSNGPVPQGGGNGSGQANAIPDTDAPAGAVSEAEATGAGNQPNDPLNQNPTGRLTPLDDPRIAKYAGDLRSMAPDAGYAERGGRNLRDYNDNFTSRTVWIPTAEWFLPGMLNSPQASVDAVERAIRGYPMKKKEKLHVQGMMDFLDRMNGVDDESHAEQLATLSDIAYEGESADAQNIIDTLGDVDLESNGAWADEVESMRALGFTEEEINEITRRKQGAFGAIGEEAAGVPAGEAQTAIPEGDGNGNGQAEGQEGFSLNQQTNTEAAAEYKRQQEEAVKKDNAAAPETERVAGIQDENWLKELFGNEAGVQGGEKQPTAKPSSLDLSGLINTLRDFSNQKLAEANDWASRKYKENNKQINLSGDGPTRQESISVNAANESRRRKNVEALQKQAQMASNLANRIERGHPVSDEIAQAIRAADSDIQRDGKPRFGQSRNDQIEAYISNSMLGDDFYGFGDGTVSSLLRKAYEGNANQAEGVANEGRQEQPVLQTQDAEPTGVPDQSESVAQSAQVAEDVPGATQASDVGNLSIDELQKQLEDAKFGERIELNGILIDRVTADIEQAIANGDIPVYSTGNGTFIAVHPSAQNDGMIQVTRYSDRGVMGDSQYNNVREAVRDNVLWTKKRMSQQDAEKAINDAIIAEADYQEQKRQFELNKDKIPESRWFSTEDKAEQYVRTYGYGKRKSDAEWRKANAPIITIKSGSVGQGGFNVILSEFNGEIEDKLKQAANAADKTLHEARTSYKMLIHRLMTGDNSQYKGDYEAAVASANRTLNSTIAKYEEEKRKKVDQSAPEQKQESKQDDTEFTHNGVRIYPIAVNVGGDRKQMWGVESSENKAKREAGQRYGFGDSLLDTKEQAVAAADRQIANDEATEKYEESRKAKEAEEAKRKAEIESDTYNGFLDGQTPAKKGLIRKALAKQWRFDGVVMTSRERIESLLAKGELEVGSYEEDKIKPMSRTQFNRASQREQDAHEKKVREGGKVTVYTVSGSDLGKIAHDYASFLLSQQKADTATKAEEQAAPVSQPENDKPAYADDAELQDALSHLGDVLGDVFGAKLNITGKQYGASDLLPAMSKVIELLIKKGFKSFRESVGAATNAMRGNANTKGFVDHITPRQWKAAYNSVAEFHEGTESEEDVAKYSAEQIQKIISSNEGANQVDVETKKTLEDISRVVSAGKDKGRNGNKEFATYKKIGDSEAKIIEEKTGITNIAGYQHQIDESAVRHIFKQHGNDESESKRGQVAITTEDFKRLPEITDPLLADSIDRGESQEGGSQTIVYRKKFDDTLYVVEEVRTGRQYLALKTMWKVRAAQRATDESGFAHTSETLGSQPSTGSKNIVQDNALRNTEQPYVSLDKFGLTVRRSQTKNGTPTWEVSGNTRDHVAVLRNAGGKWYGPKKVWSFYSEESPEGKILAALGASPASAEVALSEIEVERKSEGTGRIKTYKQRADEALSEIDERMSLGKQLLECLNS